MTRFPADLLERYEMGECLATGGFGAVYEARHRLLGRKAAVKLLHGGAGADAEQAARFFGEARIAAQLEHPNLVRLLDHGGGGESAPWIAYEFAEGRTVAALLEDGPLPVATAVAIALSVAAALSVAHARGIVHRDVKPENVLQVAPDRWALIDFGIALWNDALRVKTATGVFLGTPPYVAPEIIQGESAGPGADQYALGAMLYEMLVGAPPFGPGARRAGVPEALDAIVVRMLSKSPPARFATLDELGQELAAVDHESAAAAGATVPVRPTATGSGRTARVRRTGNEPAPRLTEVIRPVPARRVWVAAAALLVAALLALGWPRTGGPPPRPSTAATPASPPETWRSPAGLPGGAPPSLAVWPRRLEGASVIEPGTPPGGLPALPPGADAAAVEAWLVRVRPLLGAAEDAMVPSGSTRWVLRTLAARAPWAPHGPAIDGFLAHAAARLARPFRPATAMGEAPEAEPGGSPAVRPPFVRLSVVSAAELDALFDDLALTGEGVLSSRPHVRAGVQLALFALALRTATGAGAAGASQRVAKLRFAWSAHPDAQWVLELLDGRLAHEARRHDEEPGRYDAALAQVDAQLDAPGLPGEPIDARLSAWSLVRTIAFDCHESPLELRVRLARATRARPAEKRLAGDVFALSRKEPSLAKRLDTLTALLDFPDAMDEPSGAWVQALEPDRKSELVVDGRFLSRDQYLDWEKRAQTTKRTLPDEDGPGTGIEALRALRQVSPHGWRRAGPELIDELLEDALSALDDRAGELRKLLRGTTNLAGEGVRVMGSQLRALSLLDSHAEALLEAVYRTGTDASAQYRLARGLSNLVPLSREYLPERADRVWKAFGEACGPLVWPRRILDGRWHHQANRHTEELEANIEGLQSFEEAQIARKDLKAADRDLFRTWLRMRTLVADGCSSSRARAATGKRREHALNASFAPPAKFTQLVHELPELRAAVEKQNKDKAKE